MNAPSRIAADPRTLKRLDGAQALSRLALRHHACLASVGGRSTALTETTELQFLREVIHQYGGNLDAVFAELCRETGITDEGYPLDPDTGEAVFGADKVVVFECDGR